MGFSGLPKSNIPRHSQTWLARVTCRQIIRRFIAPKTSIFPSKSTYLSLIAIDIACIILVFAVAFEPARGLLSPFVSPIRPLEVTKSNKEVFGFAPHWTFDRLDNVDFDVLTTLAYFDIPVQASGELDKDSLGYRTFKSKAASELFRKAHRHNSRVVVTFTQMQNVLIKRFLDNPEAQKKMIEQAISEVKDRGIDGANIDFEYIGDPGQEYRAKFSKFVADFTLHMHDEVPGSRVTVSVYASAAKDPKMYAIKALSDSSDGIFMMAYDFAATGAEEAMPTAPLYGHKTGDYWYDVSSAVDDFLAQVPAVKLILGLPWYGYNYAVYEPGVKADTHKGYYVYSYVRSKRGKRKVRSLVKLQPATQTYSLVADNVHPDMPGIKEFKTGWDEAGQVGYKAYYSLRDASWRMIFMEDTKSLAIKYDFAKEKGLGGVGVWALGFDDGKREMWDLLAAKFGGKRIVMGN